MISVVLRKLAATSLRTKMVVAYVGLVVVLGLAGSLHARLTLSGVSDSELDRRALAVARDLEGRSSELLLTNDIFGLHRRIGELAAADQEIRYIVVFDANGAARASTFPTGLPDGLRGSNPLEDDNGYSLKTLQTSEGQVRDIAFSIDGGQAGVLRIGFKKELAQSRVDRLTWNLVGLTGAALVAGLVVMYWLATVLTRPVARLTEAAHAVGRGETPALRELYSHPELGQVAVAFDGMTVQLRERDAERSQLLARVLTAQEDERRRISRELHDEAGQALTSVLLGLTRLEQTALDTETSEEAAALRVRAGETLDLMRSLARDLRPSTLDDLGLVAALRRYVADYGPRHGLTTDFQAVSMDGVRLPSETETALYRIAQEALTNVSRHARAQFVNVLIERRGNLAILVIEDDGIGFEPARKDASVTSTRLGLLGMGERAALIGGTLTIESRPGGGTSIFVEAPLREPPE